MGFTSPPFSSHPHVDPNEKVEPQSTRTSEWERWLILGTVLAAVALAVIFINVMVGVAVIVLIGMVLGVMFWLGWAPAFLVKYGRPKVVSAYIIAAVMAVFLGLLVVWIVRSV